MSFRLNFRTGGFWAFLGLGPRPFGGGRSKESTMVIRCLLEGSIPAWAGEPLTPYSCPFRIWVYPRVGGGTRKTDVGCWRHHGLSPRGRGNLRDNLTTLKVLGSIPAWAGEEPPHLQPSVGSYKVYPRVGGGTPPMTALRYCHQGLSPVGGGTLSPGWCQPRVYPRVGGGTPISPIPTRLEYRRSQL